MRCGFSDEAMPYAITPVDNIFLHEYMPRADGFFVQVYLCGLMLCHYPNRGDDSIGDILGRKESDVLEAFVYWQGEGLVRILSDEPLEVEYLSLRPSGYGKGLRVPGQRYGFVEQVQNLLAPRSLGNVDLRHLFDFVEVFSLSEDAVVELVKHCIEIKGKRVGVKYMSTVARAWADADVHTLEDAREHIRIYRDKTSGAASVVKRMGMHRSPTEDELALYAVWTEELAFSPEAILSACTALTNACTPSFRYLNGILIRMHKEGTKLEEEIARVLKEDDDRLSFAREVFTYAGIAKSPDLTARAMFSQFVGEWGMEKDLIFYVAKMSAGKNNPLSYLKKVVNNLQDKGIKTVAEAEKETENRPRAKSKTKKTAALGYAQHTYSDDELSHLFVDLDTDKKDEGGETT